MWVGLNDAGENGVWRFFNGDKYDGFDESKAAAWYFHSGHGFDEDQKCADVADWGDSEGVVMHDYFCDSLWVDFRCAVLLGSMFTKNIPLVGDPLFRSPNLIKLGEGGV